MKLLVLHSYLTFFKSWNRNVKVDAAHTPFLTETDVYFCSDQIIWVSGLCVCVCESENHRYTAAGNVHSLTLYSFILVIIIPPSNQKRPDSIMILPKGLRWWLVLQRQLSFHFSTLAVSFLPFFPFFVFLKASNILLLLIKLTDTLTQTDTHTVHVHTHTQADTALWLGFIQGSSGGSPISVGCVCMSVCVRACLCFCLWGGGTPVLVDSGASNYSPSVTSNYSFGLLTHTACLCVCLPVFVVHLQLCCADVRSHKYPLVIWLGRCYFHHTQGQFNCFCFSQRYRLISLFLLF